MAVGSAIQLLTRSAGLCLVAALAAAQPTFHRDIEPILRERCAPCHRAGGAAPFPLLTYDDARKRAPQIAAVTRKRYMPPWLPEPGYGDFADSLRLTDIQIEVIERWARAGALEGKGAARHAPVFTDGWQLGTPDLIIAVEKPFTVPADGPDVFWNFILSPPLRQSRQLRAVEIRPGNPASVHHANLVVDRARSLRDQEKVRGEGFPGMDVSVASDTFEPDSHFLFWKPGTVPWREPQGMSWRLDPGNDLVLNVHLRATGKPVAVQPSIGLYFTDEPQTKFPMLLQLEHDGDLHIPAGASDFIVTDELRLPVDVDVLAIYPHAHYLGHLLEASAALPDGKHVPLIRIPDWDLNWQAVYRYREPVFLPKDTVVSMRYHYDNSVSNPRNPNSPPKLVQAGNQASDEMAHLWLQVLPRGSKDDRMLLQEAMMNRRLEKYPADFSANFNLGALFLARKEFAPAISHLQNALRAAPEDAIALNTLGAALETVGKQDEAIEQFQHALRIRPSDSHARYNLAGALAAQGRFDQAVEAFREVVAANPGDQAARERLISALREAGDAAVTAKQLPKAAQYYRGLVELQPNDADLRNNYGILLARLGDYSSAIMQFEAALRINPSHEAARRNLDLARKH